MIDKVNVLGVEFNNGTKEEFVEIFKERLKKNEKTFVVTANPEIVMQANKDSQYMNTLKQANFIVPDGIGVVYGAKLLKRPIVERVAGFDLLKDLLTIANEERLRVFFLGAKEEVVGQAIANVEKDYPNLEIAGYHNGFFKGNDPKVVAKVKEANADIVFVALGFPRQENWIHENISQFEKGYFMGVGGSFDVLAGAVKRAPNIWIKLNMEWLYRLLKQPQRFKRMAFLPLFIFKVFQSRKTRD